VDTLEAFLALVDEDEYGMAAAQLGAGADFGQQREVTNLVRGKGRLCVITRVSIKRGF